MSPNTSAVALRDAAAGDLDYLVELNNAAVPHVNAIDAGFLRSGLGSRAQFRVIEESGAIRAFMLAFGKGVDYASSNYQWFNLRYERFLYVDRIVVREQDRQRGFGRRLYEDLFAEAKESVCPVTCEVNLDPPNPESLAFHRRLGFRQVGEQRTEGGTKLVALLVRDLPIERPR